MCSTVVVPFVVSAFGGLVSGVLENYRLNDKRNFSTANATSIDETDNSCTEHEVTFLPTDIQQNHPDGCYLRYDNDGSPSCSASRQNSLDDFDLRYDEDDLIYEEFIPNDNDHDRLAWRLSRPSAYSWFWECIKATFYITVLSGFFIGGATVLLMFIDINTAVACSTVNWNDIPIALQRLVVVAESCTGWIIQLFHIFTMYCVFGWSLIKDLNLMSLNLIAAYADSIYRLSFHVFDCYGLKWKDNVLYILFILMVFINSYSIAKHFCKRKSRIAILTIQLGSQFSLGTITVYIIIYVLIPWFVHLSLLHQAITAAATPVIFVIPKVASRLAAQYMSGICHPGTSYVLVLAIYTESAILCRILQADIESFKIFVLLSFVHGGVGLLERISVVARDHFYIWFYKKILKRENIETYIGSFRTPRTQRLVADITVCTMIIEVMALVLSNAFVQLYALQFKFRVKISGMELLYKFFIRTMLSISIEFVFSVFGVYLATWYQNIPLVRVWKKKYKPLFLINFFMCGMVTLYCTHYVLPVVDVKWKHKLNLNGTTECVIFGSKFKLNQTN